MRRDFESLGTTWAYKQVGTPFVRIAAQMLPRMYRAYRLNGPPARTKDTGPREYISLYAAMWPTFTTTGAQARAIIDRLPAIELDSNVRGAPSAQSAEPCPCAACRVDGSDCNAPTCRHCSVALRTSSAFHVLPQLHANHVLCNVLVCGVQFGSYTPLQSMES